MRTFCIQFETIRVSEHKKNKPAHMRVHTTGFPEEARISSDTHEDSQDMAWSEHTPVHTSFTPPGSTSH